MVSYPTIFLFAAESRSTSPFRRYPSRLCFSRPWSWHGVLEDSYGCCDGAYWGGLEERIDGRFVEEDELDYDNVSR